MYPPAPAKATVIFCEAGDGEVELDIMEEDTMLTQWEIESLDYFTYLPVLGLLSS